VPSLLSFRHRWQATRLSSTLMATSWKGQKNKIIVVYEVLQLGPYISDVIVSLMGPTGSGKSRVRQLGQPAWHANFFSDSLWRLQPAGHGTEPWATVSSPALQIFEQLLFPILQPSSLLSWLIRLDWMTHSPMSGP
jgi:hypothetical protein